MAHIAITDGVIRITDLDVQDGRAAAALSEYPEAKWAEVTRRAIKIGLGVLRGGAKEAGH